MAATKYGEKSAGKSEFVVVASHAAGDDMKTAIVARKLAEKLKASLIINKKYFKPSNSRADKIPERVEDFNDLTWSTKRGKYVWRRKQPDMKLFYNDLDTLCEKARKYSPKNKATAIHIHGIYSKDVGIDIGVGVKKFNHGNKVFGSIFHKESGGNTGAITLKISLAKKIKKELNKNLKKDHDLTATLGESYSGWSRQSAIQFHKHSGRDDYAIQFEINHTLRSNKESRNYTVNLLAETLTKILT